MIQDIYFLLIIVAFEIMVISLVYNGKKGVKVSLVLISAILFILLSLFSFQGIERNYCEHWESCGNETIEEDPPYKVICEHTEGACLDEPTILSGLGAFFSGISLFCFVMLLIFVFNFQTEDNKNWG